jgi:membrane protease YdiL (CAAX protease family)
MSEGSAPASPARKFGDPPSAANWGAGVAALGALGAIFAGVFLGIPVIAIEPEVGTDDASAAANIALQVATVAGFLIVPILIATKGDLSTNWTTLRQRLGITGFAAKDLGWALLAYVAYLIFAGIYAQLVGVPEQDDIADFFGPIGMQVLLIVVAASISEEICFRGMLYGGLRTDMGPIPAALISGLIFGALHALTGLSAVPVLIALGIALALLFEKTGSIVPGIILHAVNNALALLVA